MARASEAAVRAAAHRYWGAVPNDVNMAVEIARIESGFELTAHNPVGRDDSYGAMQINMRGDLGPARRRQFNLSSNEQLWDLDTNMRVAHGIWEQNGRSFFGTQAWWTSAVAAAAKLRLTGLTGQTGGSDTPAPPALTAEEQAVWDALPEEVKKHYLLTPVGTTPTKHPDVTDEQHRIALKLYTWQHANEDDFLPFDLPSIPNPLDWMQTLAKFFGTLIDPQFWKRIGLGALAAAIILIAVVFFGKSVVTNTAKDVIE